LPVLGHNFDIDIGRGVLGLVLMLIFLGLHEKQAMKHEIWLPTQHSLLEQQKPRKNLIDLVRVKTFQIDTYL
jgi:hypothetical protein